jgi:hypothetical protein
MHLNTPLSQEARELIFVEFQLLSLKKVDDAKESTEVVTLTKVELQKSSWA